MMNRTECILNTNPGWITMVIDEPKIGSKGNILVCHGLTGDRSGPQNLLSILSKSLAGNGFRVIRFDFRGSGDSSGTFYNTTFKSMLEDFHKVNNFCMEKFNSSNIGVLGMSIGGVIASLASIQVKAKALALISSDIIEGITFGVHGQYAIRNGHFLLPETFWREREKIFPRYELSIHQHMQKYLCFGELDHKVEEASSELRNIGFSCRKFSDVNHLFEKYNARLELGLELSIFFESSFQEVINQ